MRAGSDMAFHPANAGVTLSDGAVARFRAFRSTKLYDLLAATPLIAWNAFCLGHQLPALVDEIAQTDVSTTDIGLLAGLASKIATRVFFAVLVVLLVLRDKPRVRTAGLYPRLAAFAGTYLGVAMILLPSRELPAAWAMASTLVVLCGTALAISAALSLGRSLSMLPEARRLVTAGPYGLVRHPLYLSEAVALLGVTMQYLSPLALVLFAIQCAFQFERMKNEERVLASTFPEYRAYIEKTARLVPGLY
jgi:protein-S-isoprenylcysteine O-methyltransferase Ste14